MSALVPDQAVYTAFFPFCGLGAGAYGFLEAETHLFGTTARFRSLGGLDFDAEACADFEYLTGTKALCIDVATMTVEQLRAFVGPTAPDVVFLSPPCKGSSGLLSEAKAKTAKYLAMNELALIWVRLMLEAWPTPPKLVLFENVPRIKKRAATMLRKVRSLLHQAGYLSRDGFHDCGEPLRLAGTASSRWRERIGNAVPPPAAQAIAERMLGTLLQAAAEGFSLNGDAEVWVDEAEAAVVS